MQSIVAEALEELRASEQVDEKLNSGISDDLTFGGHTAAWGSWFDTATNRWGYACCHGVSRGESCAAASTADDGAVGCVETGLSPQKQSLLPRASFQDSEEFVLNWARVLLREWGDLLVDGSLVVSADAYFGASSRLCEAEKASVPLFKALDDRSLDNATVLKLERIATLALNREYCAANQAYLDLTLGNVRWHTMGALHSQDVTCGKKKAISAAREKHVGESVLNGAVGKDGIFLVKRLVSLSQLLCPSADVSKQFAR